MHTQYIFDWKDRYDVEHDLFATAELLVVVDASISAATTATIAITTQDSQTTADVTEDTETTTTVPDITTTTEANVTTTTDTIQSIRE